jgi:CheY-like chemotaxis protein
MLQRLIGENIDLRWTPADGLWPVQADPSQIDQILTNLCLNARDAIAGTGHLDIAAANCSLPEPPARHPDAAAGDYVRLTVRDDGPGIDPELLEHLFEPFFSTKDPDKGTGLGLPMVFGIVRQHNGFIDVESEAGRGTAFHIHLPRHAGQPAEPAPPPPPPPPRSERKTILLVEDEPSILAMTASVLDSLGYAVRSAVSPADAIRLAREDSHPIHLLLTDIIIPGMNGRDLARTLCALRPGLRVLYMSGYPAEVIARNGVLDDSLAFIPKPFNRADLAAKLREVLGA